MSKELFSIFKLKDPYLDYNKSYNRIKEEYDRFKSIVVAYDFENCVFNQYSKPSHFDDIVDLLKRLKENSCFLICFTTSTNLKLVRNYLEESKIPYDRINENPPFYKCTSRKIYYNALLDSRAGMLQVYNQLATLCNEVEIEREFNKKEEREYA